MRISHYFFIGLYLLIVAGFLLSGIHLPMLLDWDENIYAEASRQMVLRQDYLNIYINNAPFAEKPPFFFWLQSLSYHLFGINEFSARFPSAFIGLLMTLVLIMFGQKLLNLQFGIIWSAVFATSLMPSILGKAAVIDHTFNFFITIGAFSLYFYDQSQAYQKWKWLIFASIAMGLATLTKGPLGGVIPLVAFISYKFFYRLPKVPLLHFGFCSVVSLSIATCWYWINWLLYGSSFLERFIEFQTKLFSQSLEGHQAPFYYHFLVAILGLAPWSAFLLGFQKSMFFKQDLFKQLLILCLGWILFVLILFSFVQTKLPHYSASIYIPLSLLVAVILYQYIHKVATIKRWQIITLLIFWTLVLSALPAIFPQLVQEYQSQFGVKIESIETGMIYGLGMITFCLLISAIFLIQYEKIKHACLAIFFAMVIFTYNVWNFQLPIYAVITQQTMIDLVKEAHQKGRLVFYRYVSFAALFYGKQPIEMLHTYKFVGHTDILNQQSDTDIFVLTSSEHIEQLQKEHPLVKPYKQIGHLFMGVVSQKAQ